MSFSSWVNKWIFQMAHVLAGMLIAISSCIVFPDYWPWLGVVPPIAFGAVKEFIFDPLTEDVALSGGRKGDAIDFGFFVVGGVLGTAAFKLLVHFLLQRAG